MYNPDYFKLPRAKFLQHRVRARRRGIPFLLSFDQWWSIWERSGHWNKRGCGRRGYCMARYGDKGAYEVGNVRIITNAENAAEYECSAEARAKMAVAKMGHAVSAATRAKLSRALKGSKLAAETRAKISAALKGRKLSAEAKARMMRGLALRQARLRAEDAELLAYAVAVERVMAHV